MLTLNNLSKKYSNNQKLILDEINCSFPNKGVVVISGPNGSGKTTLLRIISGFDNDYQGSVVYNQKSISRFKAIEIESYRQNEVSYVTQSNTLPLDMSVKELVELSFSLSEKSKTLEEILETNELLDSYNNLKSYKSSYLSGGEQQLVCLMISIVKNPNILILDEPFASLDIENSDNLIRIINGISKNKLCIIVTHQINYLGNLQYKEYALESGKLVLINDLKNKTSSKEISQDNTRKPSVSKLKFKNISHFARKLLFKSPKQLFLSFIITLISLVSFSFSLMCMTMNKNSLEIDMMNKENYKYALLIGDTTITTTYQNHSIESETSILSNKQIKEIEDYSIKTNDSPLYVYDFVDGQSSDLFFGYDYSNLDIQTAPDFFLDSRNNPFKNLVSLGTLEIPLNYQNNNNLFKIDSRFNDPSLSKFPTNFEEIALTDFQFDLMKEYGILEENIHIDINTPDDLIGRKIGGMKITGVFETPEDISKYREYNGIFRTDDIRYKSLWERVGGTHICGLTITLEGQRLYTIEKTDHKILHKMSAIVPLSNTNLLKNITKQMSYTVTTERDGTTNKYNYGVKLGSEFSSIYDSYWILRNKIFIAIVTLASAIFLGLSIFSNIQLTLSFFKNSELEFAFLMKLGVKRFDLFKIASLNIAVLFLIELLLMLSLSSVIALVLNEVATVILLTLNLITIFVTLVVTFLSLYLSTIPAYIKLFRQPLYKLIK